MREKEPNPFDPPGRLRNVGRIVFYALAVLLILLLIAVLVSVTVLRKRGEPPSVFGFSVYIVATDSMEPTITPGSALLVRRTDPADLRVDDVITFQEGYNQDGQLLINTHRIVEIVDSGGTLAFRTKGDRSAVPDETLCQAENVIGRAVSYMPGIGKFFAFVKTPIGLVCCIAVPLLILLVFEIINLVRLSRRSGEDELLEEEETAQQGPLARAVNRRRALFGIEEGHMEEPPPAAEAPRTPVQAGLELPPESILRTGLEGGVPILRETPELVREPDAPAEAESVQTVVSSPYGFAIPAERVDVPLEKPREEAPVVPADFERTGPRIPAPVHVTREFPKAVSAPVPPAEPVPSDEDPAFLADLASKGKDRFKIDGIDVRVKPDSINLALEGDREERDISITVTEEYTNVTVGTEGREVNFALFRDEKGQKVIIQKKVR